LQVAFGKIVLTLCTLEVVSAELGLCVRRWVWVGGSGGTRAQARDEREALRVYQQGREADAAAQTRQVESRLADLAGLLANVAALPPFHLEQLKLPPRAEPFKPGPLGVPVVMPERRVQREWAV
jgi:hypothetical protein